jgi:hypothetical protein
MKTLTVAAAFVAVWAVWSLVVYLLLSDPSVRYVTSLG